MRDIRITVMARATHQELIDKYENHLDNPCDMKLGQRFISKEAKCPDGFCLSAWDTILPFVKDLSTGKGNFYNGWMKNPLSALISCNDGFRPVSFLLEVMDE